MFGTGAVKVELLAEAVPDPDKEPTKKELVLDAVVELGRTTAEGAAQKTGINIKTVQNAFAELLGEGVLADTGEKAGRSRIVMPRSRATKGTGTKPRMGILSSYDAKVEQTMKRIDSELGGGGAGLSLPASDRGFMADMNGIMQVCGAITRSGARCSARAIEGSQWCYNHDPGGAQRRREAAQAGGRARWSGGTTKEIERAKSKISNITEQVLVGELDPKRGAVAVQATQALLRALELEVKSRELDEIEARLRDFEKELLDERGRPKATESSRR